MMETLVKLVPLTSLTPSTVIRPPTLNAKEEKLIMLEDSTVVSPVNTFWLETNVFRTVTVVK